MIDCAMSMFSPRYLGRHLWLAAVRSVGRRRFLSILIACVALNTNAQSNSALNQGTWFLLQTTSDDMHVINGIIFVVKRNSPLSFSTLGLFSSGQGPLQEDNGAHRANGLQEMPTYHLDQTTMDF